MLVIGAVFVLYEIIGRIGAKMWRIILLYAVLAGLSILDSTVNGVSYVLAVLMFDF